MKSFVGVIRVRWDKSVSSSIETFHNDRIIPILDLSTRWLRHDGVYRICKEFLIDRYSSAGGARLNPTGLGMTLHRD